MLGQQGDMFKSIYIMKTAHVQVYPHVGDCPYFPYYNVEQITQPQTCRRRKDFTKFYR